MLTQIKKNKTKHERLCTRRCIQNLFIHILFFSIVGLVNQYVEIFCRNLFFGMYISSHSLSSWVNCVPSPPQIKPVGCIAGLCAWVAMVSGRKEGTLAALSYMFVHWSRDERPLAKPRWSNWPLTFVLLQRVVFCTHLNRAAGKAAFGFWRLKSQIDTQWRDAARVRTSRWRAYLRERAWLVSGALLWIDCIFFFKNDVQKEIPCITES